MLRKFTRSLAAVGVAGLLVAGAAACSAAGGSGSDDQDGAAGEGTLARLQSAGEITVPVGETMPYSGLTPSGEATGYFPEVAGAIFAELGIPTMNAKVTDYGGMIPGLNAKQWDAVVAPLNVTTERCEVVIFSDPMTVGLQSFTVLEGNPEDIEGIASFTENSDITLAVLAGSAEEAMVIEQGVPSGQLMPLPDQNAMTDAVLAGRADAFMIGKFSSDEIVKVQSGLENFALEDVPAAITGIAFRPDDTELRDAYNTELKKLRESGELAELYKKWGFNEDPELLGTKTLADAAEGCK